MKTTKLIITGLFMCALTVQAQTTLNNASVTSGGVQSGTLGTGNTFYGYKAGLGTTGNQNVFIGHSLTNTNTANQSVNIGNSSNIGTGGISIGYQNYTTGRGIAIGRQVSAINNSIAIGDYTSVSGSSNIVFGNWNGIDLTGSSNNNNIFIGSSIASDRTSSSNNIFIGNGTGSSSQGNNCIFIGHGTGNEINGNNLLFIDNANTSTPLIWGDFAANQLKFHGKVGIGFGFGNIPSTAGGINVSSYNLFVYGGILTDEVRIMLNTQWADYVFEKDYKLPKLEDVEQFIVENKHLPNVPSAAEVAENGIELGEIAKIQQEKIEELTLYIIEQNKINKDQTEQIARQQEELNELKEQVKLLLETKN